MNKILMFLLCAWSVFAIEPFTYYWTINPAGDYVRPSYWRNNNDSVLLWSDKICDTVNTVVPRWNWFSNHDSTFKWMNIDTISGSVIMDSLTCDYLNASEISIDTLQRLVIDTLLGNDRIISGRGDIDTIYSDLIIIGKATIDTLYTSGEINFDSIDVNYIDAITISSDTITGNAYINNGRLLSDTAVIDSLYVSSLNIAGDWINVHDTSFTVYLNDAGTPEISATGKLFRIGKMVTFNIPALSSTLSGGIVTISGIPSTYCPVSSTTILAPVVSNSTATVGKLYYTGSGIFEVYDDSGYMDAGTGGTTNSQLTWYLP